jgi:hypothetical protein
MLHAHQPFFIGKLLPTREIKNSKFENEVNLEVFNCQKGGQGKN